MREIIEEIINRWDPLGLLPYSPKDEYGKEIAGICEALESTRDVGVLGANIHQIFIDGFGKDIFNNDIDECMVIAESILERILATP